MEKDCKGNEVDQRRAYGFRNFENYRLVCVYCAVEMAGELFGKRPLKGVAPVFGVEPLWCRALFGVEPLFITADKTKEKRFAG